MAKKSRRHRVKKGKGKKGKHILPVFFNSVPKIHLEIPRNIEYGPGIVLLGKMFDNNVSEIILGFSGILQRGTKRCWGYLCEDYIYKESKKEYCGRCVKSLKNEGFRFCGGCKMIKDNCVCFEEMEEEMEANIYYY